MVVKRRTHEIYFKKNEGGITGSKLLLRKKEDNPAVFLALLTHRLFDKGDYVIGNEIPQITDTKYTYASSPIEKKIGTMPYVDETRYVVEIELSSGILSGVLELEIDNNPSAKKNRKKEDRYTSLCVKSDYFDYRIIVKKTGQTVDIYKQDTNELSEVQESFFINSENSVSEVQKYIESLLK